MCSHTKNMYLESSYLDWDHISLLNKKNTIFHKSVAAIFCPGSIFRRKWRQGNFLTYTYNLPEIIDSLSSNLLFLLFMQIKSITYSHICVICTCIMGSRNHKRVQWHITNNMAIFIHPIGSQTHAVHFHCPISWT